MTDKPFLNDVPSPPPPGPPEQPPKPNPHLQQMLDAIRVQRQAKQDAAHPADHRAADVDVVQDDERPKIVLPPGDRIRRETTPDELFDLGKALQSARRLDSKDERGEETVVGNALAKHAGRPENGEKWPTPSGTRNPDGWTTTGQRMLDAILANPDSAVDFGYGRIGGKWQDTLDVRLPDGRGARFGLDSVFSGFLD